MGRLRDLLGWVLFCSPCVIAQGKVLLPPSELLASRRTVNTVAELTALVKPEVSPFVVHVLGYSAAGDGGGGFFSWDASSEDPANGGTILKADAGGTGRWIRLFSGPIDVRWFGASREAGDDRAAIQAALNVGGDVLVPAGTFTVSSALSIPLGTTGLVLRGAGRGRTIIENTGSGHCLRSVGDGNTGNWNVVIADLSLRGHPGSAAGIFFDFTYHSQIERVEVTDHGADGIKIQRGFYNDIRSPWCRGNGGHGILFGEASNACNVYGGHVEYNGGNGILVSSEASAGATHGVTIYGTTFESNDASNLGFTDVDECRAYGCYFESQPPDVTLRHVLVTGTSSWNVIDGCNFSGDNATGTLVSVLVDHADDTIIQNCSINNGVTITANASRTRLMNNARVQGAVSDLSATTIMLNDPQGATGPGLGWYAKNGTSKWEQRVFSDSTHVSFGTGYYRFNFDGLQDAFRWKRVDANGDQLAVMHFGAYRVWVSPVDGKMYIKGGDPVAHNDGTVVGSQN